MTGEQSQALSSPRDSEDGSVTLEQQPKVCMEILSVFCSLQAALLQTVCSFLFRLFVY